MKSSNDMLKCDDHFKEKFKYFKFNKAKHFYNDLITVENQNKVVSVKPVNVSQKDERDRFLGLRDAKHWNVFTFPDHPGLYFIRNPFTSLGQRYWIRKCLEVYPRKPNKMNLDNEMSLQDWWAKCYEVDKCNKQIQKKLRWTTLGYHHNWDTKVYSEENKSPFPEDLAELTDIIANYLGYDNFHAEAAIVNYYHMDSTLSAHTDHSEVNLDAPLFSFSFGQSAVFLIGGKEKSLEPSAILLNSGDIVVMSKESRLCYHAVPKILPASSTSWNQDLIELVGIAPNYKYIKNNKDVLSLINRNVNNKEWSRFNSYIQESRINMNVRQVLNERQTSLTDYFNNP